MVKPNPVIQKQWIMRGPIRADAGDATLDYWIEKSSVDEWTYDDLERLVGELIDDADAPMPPALNQWALERAAGRRPRPSRTGPKSNPKRDVGIMLCVEIAMAHFGDSQRAAFRRIGDGLNMSPQAVETARRRVTEFVK